MDKIKIGIKGEATTTATADKLATHLGSGGIEVYATPAMIALMEGAAIQAIDHLLPEGQASVGVALNIKHLAATPAEQTVRAEAEVTAVDGRQVTFNVKAWDEQELIGEGVHTRFVITIERFMQRVTAKLD